MTEPGSAPGGGERIGPYQITGILARGGMGEVYLARDDRLNRWVAIKRIRHDSDTLILRQRLLQEAHAVGGLHHPAIVLVYDLLEHEDDQCIVMEYVQGQTLAETLKAGPLAPALAVRVARPVASGLAAAHEAGFIHRDLKAENVMVTPSGEAKILDFGLAKPIGIPEDDPALTAAGHVVGTCRSMSPEQARGAEVDARSDLFSLGVLLYEMLTGVSPFQGSNALETLSKVVSERPPCADTLRPGLPPRLVALLYRLLAKDPAARPQSAAEVLQELHAIAASMGLSGDLDIEETVSALPTDTIRRWGGDPTPPLPPLQAVPAPVPESPPRPRRRRLEIALLSFLMALVVGVALWLIWRPKPPDLNLSPLHPKLLWVVVLSPQGAGHDTKLRRAALALEKASLSALGNLQGIIPMGPVINLPKDGTVKTAAEDFLTVTLKPSGNWGYITLSRIHGKDGRVLKEVPLGAAIDAQHLQYLKAQVEAKLPELFFHHTPREDVRKEDYAAFFEIEQRIDEGQEHLESVLPELDKIVETSPGFLEAQLLEADITVMLYQKSHHERDRERALALIRKAKELAPDDPRPFQREFMLALTRPQKNEAQDILSKLEKLSSVNPQIPVFLANLADKDGNLAGEYKAWKDATDSMPSWRNILKLAHIEEELGFPDDARSHLEQILRNQPGNSWALQRLAELELDYGDPASAEKIYVDLINLPTHDDYYTYANLGTARVLLHHYTKAVSAFQKALKIKPDDAEAMLNLADAELAMGSKDAAKKLYSRVLQKLRSEHPSGELSATDEMNEAQCLAHLGDSQKAVEIAEKTVSENPEDATIIQAAALVFTLAGDPRALPHIESAINRGIQRHWFKLPAYDSLSNDPKFQRIVNGRDKTVESLSRKHAH